MCKTVTTSLIQALGVALRQARQAKGWSQEDLALKTGVHRNYIGGIERGERSPTVATVAKLAAELDTPLDELFRQARRQ